MTRKQWIGTIGASMALGAVLSVMGWQIVALRNDVASLQETRRNVIAADATAIADFPPTVEQRISAIEQRLDEDITDQTARDMADEAQQTADEARDEASAAYRKAQEPCLIHSIC